MQDDIQKARGFLSEQQKVQPEHKPKKRRTGPKRYNIKLTYAYSQNIYSSRKIETACKRDINFMWLLAGQKAPDHRTIARFRTGFLADACENLFYQMVRRLEQSGELSKETVFIDGTKLEACANKYTFAWKKSVGRWEAKMYGWIQEAVRLLNQDYFCRFQVGEETRTRDLQEICRFLEEKCKVDGTVFVHGRGKRKSRNQRYLELFRRFLERQTVYDCRLERKKQQNRRRKVTGEVKAHIYANACSEPPEGASHWTMQAIADELIRLAVVDYITDTTVCSVMKKMRSNRGSLRNGAFQEQMRSL